MPTHYVQDTARAVFQRITPVALMGGMLYTLIVVLLLAIPGYVPTGYEEHATDSRHASQYGIVGENLKLFSFELYYPGTERNTTSMLFSWYFLNACIRPLNGSNALPGMCRKHVAWESVDIHALLAEADRVNSQLLEPNATGFVESQTRAAIQGAGLDMHSGASFMLLILSVILAVSSWFVFWLYSSQRRILSPVIWSTVLVFSVVATVMLRTTVHVLSERVAGIGSDFVQNPKVNPLFFSLLWSMVAMLITAWLFALVDVAVDVGQDQRSRSRVIAERQIDTTVSGTDTKDVTVDKQNKF